MHALLTKDEPSLQMHESNLKLNQKIWGGGELLVAGSNILSALQVKHALASSGSEQVKLRIKIKQIFQKFKTMLNGK